MKKTGIKLILLCSALLLLIGFTGCNQSDLKKKSYKENVDIAISSDPSSIYALEEEITKIAYQYDESGILTEAIAVFEGDTEISSHKGTLYFTFCRDDEETGRGTTVILSYDMFDRKITKVSYEQANGIFSKTNTEPIHQGAKAILFEDIFTQVIPLDTKLYDKLQNGTNVKLTIEFTSEGIYPSLL